MKEENQTRRKYLALAGSVVGGTIVPTTVAADEPADVDTNFDPSNRAEVVQFTQGLEDVEDLEGVYRQLNQDQVKAVREVLQPRESKVDIETETTDGTVARRTETRSMRRTRGTRQTDRSQPRRVSAQSSGELERVTYRAYTTGLPPYDELWSFGLQVTWTHDGDEVDNISAKHAVETSHPLWHFDDIIDESKNDLGSAFTYYKQARFEYCEPLKFGCVGSDTPYIEVIGDSSGDHEVKSNYK